MEQHKHYVVPSKSIPMEIPSLCGFLVTYLQAGSHLFLCPFKMKYDPASITFVCLKTSRLRRALTMMFYLAYIPNVTLPELWSSYNIQDRSQAKSMRENVERLVVIFINISWALVNSVSKYELWNGQQKFMELLNKLAKVERQMQTTGIVTKVESKGQLLAIILLLHGFISGTWEMYATAEGSQDGLDSIVLWSSQKNSSWYYVVYKGFGNAITFYESQFASYSAKLVLLFAMTLYFLARRFSRLQVDDEVDGEILRNHLCAELISFSGSARNALGRTVVGASLVLIPYYCLNIQDVFSDCWSLRLLYFGNLGLYLAFMLFAAEANALVHGMAIQSPSTRRRICAGGKATARSRQQTILLHTVNAERFGMRGGIFAITYSFVGSVMTAILAYSIAIVQLESTEESDSK